MHAQIRSKTSASPPDLAKFVAVLSEPETPPNEPTPRVPINIEGISGGGVELDGEVVISVAHGREEDARRWLAEKDYQPVFVDDVFAVPLSGNAPGSLLEAIRNGSGLGGNRGRVIQDVLIGELTGQPGSFYVQIAFKEMRV